MAPPEETSSSTNSLGVSLSTLRETARIFLIGVFMGSADAVPGVSGGTIALIAGIYGRLIAAVTAITPGRLIELIQILPSLAKRNPSNRAREILDEIDAWFVLTLLTGIGTAVIIVGQAVSYVEARAPVLLFGLFFGLIAASAVVLFREITIDSVHCWVAAIAGFALAFVLSGTTQLLSGDSLSLVFVAGAVAVSAMILPGISGSLLLIILGQYLSMYAALNEFLQAIIGAIGGGALAEILEPGIIVTVFLIGGLVGLFTIARLIRRLLDAYRKPTLAFLVALIVGALRAPVAELSMRDEFVWTMGTIGQFAVIAVVGAAAVLVLDRYAIDLDLDTV